MCAIVLVAAIGMNKEREVLPSFAPSRPACRFDQFGKSQVIAQVHRRITLSGGRDPSACRVLRDLARATDLFTAPLCEAEGVSLSNVTRCFGWLCRTSTGASGL